MKLDTIGGRALICIALAIAIGLIAGCQTPPVTMVNAKGETRQCGPYQGQDLRATAAAMMEAKCIDDYKEQGFVRR